MAVQNEANPSQAAPRLFTPLRLSLFWLIGTYALFLVIGEVTKVPDLFKLTSYISLTIACLTAGYWLRANRYRGVPIPEPPEKPIKQIRNTVTISAIYYITYSVAYFGVFGITGPGALINALVNPGEAYISKYEIFEQQITAANNPLVQIVTITAALAVPLIPLSIIYFRELTGAIRLLALLGVVSYVLVFLAIGTLVGLGTVVLYALVGAMIGRKKGLSSKTNRVKGFMALALLLSGFAGYMAYNQSERLEEVGISYRYEPNPIVSKLIQDEQFARGVTVTGFYPTHGYLGLAYNMESDFVWTHGRGAARALDSYLTQYGFGSSVTARTYPSRTEVATGWDAGMYWSTIYPWLASDLTFLGAAGFMFLVGWWMARWWWEASVERRWLPLFLLSQTIILIAYIPANNQLGLSRPNLITLSVLLVLYAFSPKNNSRSPARSRATQFRSH